MRFYIFIILLLPSLVFAQESKTDEDFANLLRTDFAFAWKQYQQNAAKYDILKPATNSGENLFSQSFYLTRLEALGTMRLMSMKPELELSLKFLKENLTFSHFVNVPVGSFGDRVMSALLAEYQAGGDEFFLQKTVELANKLLLAYGSDTAMPYRLVSLGSRTRKGKYNSPAQIAALAPTFALLSKITGNKLYNRKSLQAIEALYAKRSADGLLGRSIDVETGKWRNSETNMTEDISGFHRAVLHAYLLTGNARYKQIWQESTKAVKTQLLQKKVNGKSFKHLTASGKLDESWFYSESRLPGMFALAGELDLAGKLLSYQIAIADSNLLLPLSYDLKKHKPKTNSHELLGYEAESMYYLYVYGGRTDMQQLAKNYYNAISSKCRSGKSFMALRRIDRGVAYNRMPSEFTARILKLLYLIAKPDASKSAYLLSGNAQFLQVASHK